MAAAAVAAYSAGAASAGGAVAVPDRLETLPAGRGRSTAMARRFGGPAPRPPSAAPGCGCRAIPAARPPGTVGRRGSRL